MKQKHTKYTHKSTHSELCTLIINYTPTTLPYLEANNEMAIGSFQLNETDVAFRMTMQCFQHLFPHLYSLE